MTDERYSDTTKTTHEKRVEEVRLSEAWDLLKNHGTRPEVPDFKGVKNADEAAWVSAGGDLRVFRTIAGEDGTASAEAFASFSASFEK